MAYSSEFEPVNGNLFQTIALYYGVYKPINGSYIQAICEANGYYEVINGSWLNTLVVLSYDNNQFFPIDPETGDYYYDLDGNPIASPFELINGDDWQTLLYYSNASEQSFLDNFDLSVYFPINGSWLNTYYQWLRNNAGGFITENGAIIKVSEPTWSGSNTYVFPGRPTMVILNDYIISDGDGLGCEGRITFNSNTTYVSLDGYYFKSGSGYKVGDTITLPSLAIPEITGDIVFTVLEVVEY